MKEALVGMVLVTMLCVGLSSQAQQNVTANATVVPTLVKFSGTLIDVNGKPLSGTVGVTFLLYKDELSGAPLWMETQNVTPDKNGHYTVVLGTTTAQGLPTDLFASGEARWLGVQAEGQAEQPRVLLLSVPYALKAGDAQTVGGLPASAFVLAVPPAGANAATTTAGTAAASSSASAPPPVSSNVTTTGGTVNTIPMFTTATNIQNSLLTQTGTTTINVGGTLNLPATGTATAVAGFKSRPHNFVASVFNSSTSTAVAQTFQLQAEPLNNDTASASGTLNLLYGSGTAIPAETGLKISNKGLITFATGQTFPGTGTGTVKSIGSGAGLTGGPITVSGTLSIATGGVSNTMLAHPSMTVAAGTDLAGGGVVALGGTTTLNLDTTKVPQLNVGNTFTGNQTITGNLSDTGNISATGSITGQTGAYTANNSTQVVNITQNGSGNGIVSVANGGIGLAGTGNIGVSGTGGPGFSAGVNAVSPAGFGVLASSTSGIAVFGATSSPSEPGISGAGGIGVQGQSTLCCTLPGGKFLGFTASSGSTQNGTDGVDATGGSGDPSNFSFGGVGVLGTGGNGSTNGTGLDGPGGSFSGGNASVDGGDGIDAFAGSGFAGFFSGSIDVTGTIFAGSKDFKIDHPLDPANKYLVHASVESSEMMNLYTGNVTTDAKGEATVQLPEWFEVLNTDFRYQLTVIGQFAQAIVARKIENNQFQIRTNAPTVEVSWQITGVRQDAFAKAHPLVVEEKKDARLQGFYIHPELYGAPEEKQIEWARHPQMMKQMKAKRAAAAERAPQAAPVLSPLQAAGMRYQPLASTQSLLSPQK